MKAIASYFRKFKEWWYFCIEKCHYSKYFKWL